MTFFRFGFVVSLIILVQSIGLAQSGCVEIKRILVAACGNQEGYNEMVLFEVGDNPLNTSSMDIKWATSDMANFYNFLGLVQNSTTATKVAEFNASIQSCGYFKEPVNGVLPAHSKVIVFTSHQVNTTANSFAGLTDTLIALFQNNTTQTGGHFLNYSAFAPQDEDIQTTRISFGSSCSDEVSYLRSNLVNTSGQPGNEKGSAVVFSDEGSPHYVNYGCVGIYNPYTAEWANPGTMCSNRPAIDLNDLITGSYGGTWSGQGVNGSIFNPAGLSGDISITYTLPANPDCPGLPPSSRTQTIQVIRSANASWTNPDTLCSNIASYDLNTLVTGDTGGSWTGWNVQANGIWNLANMAGTFPVIYFAGEGQCRDTLLHQVTLLIYPAAKINAIPGTSLCQADQIILKSAKSGYNLWSDGSTADSMIVTEPGVYILSRNRTCDTDKDTITIEEQLVNTELSASPDTGFAPLEAEITATTSGSDTCHWYVNDSLFVYSQSAFTFAKPGLYTIRQVCSNSFGCMDSSEVQILVMDPVIAIEIPNVFTPNGDSQNDLFQVKQNSVKTFSGIIYNRWGKKLFEWSDANSGWDGKVNGKAAAEGVYFYVIRCTDVKNQEFDFKGTVQLITGN